eukprot:9582599-Prorocentrum_lima.AAC.1
MCTARVPLGDVGVVARAPAGAAAAAADGAAEARHVGRDCDESRALHVRCATMAVAAAAAAVGQE